MGQSLSPQKVEVGTVWGGAGQCPLHHGRDGQAGGRVAFLSPQLCSGAVAFHTSKGVCHQALPLSPSCVHLSRSRSMFMQFASLQCLGNSLGNTDPLVKDFTGASLRILNLLSSPCCERSCPTGRAAGSVLCPESLSGHCRCPPMPRAVPVHGGVTLERERGHVCISPSGTCSPTHAERRVTTGRCAITGTKIPRGNQHGTY